MLYHQCCISAGRRDSAPAEQRDLQEPAAVPCGTRRRLTRWRRSSTSDTSR